MTIRSSEIVYDDFLQVRKEIIELKDQTLHPYSSLILPNDAVIILAQTPDGRYVINREYRYPSKKHLIGCPGGLLEKGEDPIIGGKRELVEETGYTTEEIYLTGSAYPFPGITDQKLYYLWAKNVTLTKNPTPDPLERIEVLLKTEAELEKEIREEPNIDAILCTALYFKHLFLKNK